ncbi:MAG: N-acetyl-alpha-D-glucosaminyl L-malate synthase BshA [Candidatus Zixiibacteriota bacterium]|nr:MAG: N-acetyl-alpha-D-glucosaminyl L-malate synthase BshA [candidate division Zixibacteria bacterium]
MNHLHIGIVCYPTFGGSGVVASELGMELARGGHAVHIVSYAPPVRITSYHPNLHFHKVEVTDYPLFEYPPYSLALASHLVEVATRERLDLVHVHYAIPHAVSAYLARQMLADRRLPFITTLHGTDITLVGNAPSFLPITRFSLEQSDAVTAVSAFLKRETEEVFGVGKKIEVIPNFVRRQGYSDPLAGDPSGPVREREEAILTHISNFRPVKRVQDVVDTFARVRRECRARLIMVGDGPDRSLAERRADELGVTDDVYFLGAQLNVEEILRLTDILLLPSQTESFGLTALEAMAAGVPVICSRVGGLPEVVTEGETGYLLPVGDIEGMAARALELLSDWELMRRMGRAARERACTQFSAERVVGQYTDLYRRVLEAPNL